MNIISNQSKHSLLADGTDEITFEFLFDNNDVPFPLVFEIEVNGTRKVINQNPFSFKTNVAGEHSIKTCLNGVTNSINIIKSIETPSSIVEIDGRDKYIRDLENKNESLQSIVDQLIIDSLMGGA